MFANQKELQAHLASAHTFCSFCNIHFFSGEELWEHVHDKHFTCQLCLRHGAHSHFNAAEDLTEHLRFVTQLAPFDCCGEYGELRVGLSMCMTSICFCQPCLCHGMHYPLSAVESLTEVMAHEFTPVDPELST